MSFLRSISNLHRGIRFLKRIGRERGDEDLGKIVDDAVGRTDETIKHIEAVETSLSKRLREYSRDVEASERKLTKATTEISRNLSETNDIAVQRIMGGQQAVVEAARTVQEVLASVNEQLTGVREYAAAQQEQVRRYQDGYSWVIVKDLGMRIIRTIDDIEAMISIEADKGNTTETLETIRDQLVFALEAEGIERFTPDVSRPVKEQLGAAKVMGTEAADSGQKAGTICQVVRPGYALYTGDDQQRKIIRSAEVVAFK